MKLLAAFLLSSLHTAAYAQDLRVLTSFPPVVSGAFADLWEVQTQDRGVLVLNKNTVAAIDEVAKGNERVFDVFMASSPEAFELLDQAGAFLSPGSCPDIAAAPAAPFALSSVGWTRRRDSDLFMPSDWNDLLRPIYRDKIAMARPARSGTTHLMVEQLLQTRGWAEGWEFILGLAGNLSTLTARSFGVPDGVEQGRFEIGLTIDFLAQSRPDTLDFRYGRPVMLAPAHIGILRGGRNPEEACAFVQMVLSREGQSLLLRPEIARIPINDQVRREHGRTPQAVEDALTLQWISYDARLSASRYWAVNALFDVMITDVLNARKSIWARLDALEGHSAASDLAAVRDLLTQPLATESKIAALGATYASDLRSTRLVAANSDQSAVLDSWRTAMRAVLDQAHQTLVQLERRVQ